MPTVSRGLPDQPHLDRPKRQARELLREWRAQVPAALERIQHRHPRYPSASLAAIARAPLTLADAQLVLAREYGFPTWAALKRRIVSQGTVGALEEAIESGNVTAVRSLLRDEPELLHLPVRSGNWGPPMSHAANLGQLEIVALCDALGAQDHQHAFERAVLQGQLACARWLLARGAKLPAGVVMGACETQNAAGFRFLLEAGAPLTGAQEDPLAPLAAVLGTYARHPAGKHEIIELLRQRGCTLPDTPVTALHRGDLHALARHLRRDPALLRRTFSLREIYPAECGFTGNPEWGLHWTPLDGTTLLHLAIDFRETEAVDWLLAAGADVNAPAARDADGFGGHTPLFQAVVNGPWPDLRTVPALLARGAQPGFRRSLRRFLDWREKPGWHIARDVTAAEWARTFPDPQWVTPGALEALG